MFEFFALSFIGIGVIEEIVVPVGSQAIEVAKTLL